MGIAAKPEGGSRSGRANGPAPVLNNDLAAAEAEPGSRSASPCVAKRSFAERGSVPGGRNLSLCTRQIGSRASGPAFRLDRPRRGRHSVGGRNGQQRRRAGGCRLSRSSLAPRQAGRLGQQEK